MGFDVHVTVTFASSPKEALMAALDHQFEEVSHAHGSKDVVIREHVSVTDEDDAREFVRSLVLDAVPEGSKIGAITVSSD